MRKWSIFGALGAIALVLGVLVVRTTGEDSAHAQTANAEDIAEAGDTRQMDEILRIRSLIRNDPVAPTIAPQGHDITIVMFSDYQCPYCRKVHPIVDTLMEEDPKIRLVYRDWPIFGAASTEAARAAIASTYQDKHAAFHDALMTMTGKLTSQGIRTAATKAGIDWNRLQSDLKTHSADIDGAIGRTREYAAMMGLSGTPGFLVGPYMIPGAVDLGGLREAVAAARANPDAIAAE